MCGRFTLIKLAEVTDLFPWATPPEQTPDAHYNIAPQTSVLTLPNTPECAFDRYVWGLVPFWAKDPSIGGKMINARCEGIESKPAFRAAIRRRRCLVPADGFYEWRREDDGTKTPMYIQVDEGKPFAFAGLWEHWSSDDGSEMMSCTIITCSPNELMENIHNRMPVILPEEHYQQWLTPDEVEPADVTGMLVPFDPGRMTATPVSRKVNNPRNNSPDLVDRVEPDAWLF